MKILHINTLDKKGGASRVMNSLNDFLNENGENSLMAVGQKLRKDKKSFSFSNHILLSNLSKSILGKDIPYVLKNRIRKKIFDENSYINNNKLLKDKRFLEADIVHFHNIHGSYLNLKTLKKISEIKPVVWTMHDAWAVLEHEIHALKKEKEMCRVCLELDIYKKLFRNVGNRRIKEKKDVFSDLNINIVTPSMWLFNIVKNSILEDNNIYLINNGVDINKFKVNDVGEENREDNLNKIKKELGLPENKKIILFLADGGKNNIFKGWEYVERLANEYENNNGLLFLCVGSKGKNKKNVFFIDYVKDLKKLFKYYLVSDFLIYPSLSDNLPLVVLEAMTSSLPVLSFRTGGIPEIIEHKKTGYLADYMDYNDLKVGFSWFIGLSRDELKKIKTNCREKVINNFSLENMNKKYFNLYKKILENYEFKG